jgi:hypothetical protein
MGGLLRLLQEIFSGLAQQLNQKAQLLSLL